MMGQKIGGFDSIAFGRITKQVKNSAFLANYYFRNAVFNKLAGSLLFADWSRYVEPWEKLRNQIGQVSDMLIVGNGPSLSPNDLSSLQRIPSIASNKIYLLFGETDWRPSLYTICDPLLAHKIRHYSFGDFEQVLCSQQIYHMLPVRHKLPWHSVRREIAVAQCHEQGEFDPDPVTGIFEAFTITGQNIQLAMWLGAKRIFLTGCDHFYEEEVATAPGKKLLHTSQNHFHPDYRKPGEVVNNAPIQEMNRSYDFLSDLARRKGIDIVNLSRRTALKTFRRDNLENIAKVGRED
jgi:hypothetical protein